MAITAITSFKNTTTDTVTVVDYENSNNNLTLPPNSTTSCNIWIPWCSSSKDYPVHHLRILGTAPDTAVLPCFIWQENYGNDGDHVRYSVDNQYHPNATHVLGDSDVGGNRQVIVQPGYPSFAAS